MAVFLFGVAAGWVSTFSLWFIWSFSLMSGLLLGALAGTAAIFMFFMLQWMVRGLSRPQPRRGMSSSKSARTAAE